jgi:uncharacterized protein (DUF433 family)
MKYLPLTCGYGDWATPWQLDSGIFLRLAASKSPANPAKPCSDRVEFFWYDRTMGQATEQNQSGKNRAHAPVSAEHIEVTPGVCGGKPRIAGHRIRVQDIVLAHQRSGLSADEIVSAFPTITLSDVYAALTYYHDHQAEIDADIREVDEFDAQLQAQGPSILEKIAARNAKNNSLPPG